MTARVFVISPSNSRLRETMPISSDIRREGNTIPTMTVCKENRAMTEQDLHHQDSYQNQKLVASSIKATYLSRGKYSEFPCPGCRLVSCQVHSYLSPIIIRSIQILDSVIHLISIGIGYKTKPSRPPTFSIIDHLGI
jgi:hypothetical protein